MSHSHTDTQITLTIDGKRAQVAAGATILDAAESVGVRIPTLCYLKKISPTGACRICVVEVAGADKTMTACNTRAVDGMEITTQSEKLSAIRRQVVELLLVNHPLDCPVCDAGGECDLQDVCYSQDVTSQPFAAEDVNAPTIDHWPLIQQVPNRCILCEKCVKVCYEVIGSGALSVNEKGDRAFIDKDLAKCEFCGNCVQVCPTGTMISKPFKFKARPWELRKTASVCTLCPAHCQVSYESKHGKVLRVTSADGVTINDGNLCVGGFFGHGYLNSDRRLTAPLLDGQPASWEAALGRVASELARIRDEAGGQALAGLAAGHLTNEEGSLFQKLFRVALGSSNLDSPMRFGLLRAVKTLRTQLGLTTASAPLETIGRAGAILVFGCDPTSEAPAVDWQVQLAHRKRDTKLVVADPRRIKLAGQAEIFLQYRPGSEVQLAGALAKLIVAKGQADLAWLGQFVGNQADLLAYLDGIDLAAACAASGVDQALLEEAADHLGSAASVAVIFGHAVTQAAGAEDSVAALINLALVSGALQQHGGIFPVGEQGNAFGLLTAGVCADFLPGFEPAAAGADAAGILAGIENGTIKALYLAGCNPLLEFPENRRWKAALAKLQLLVVQDVLESELTALAGVVLPGAAGAEKSGSLTALDGRVSPLAKAVDPPGEARADLAILADLFAALSGKPAPSEAALRSELAGQQQPSTPTSSRLQGAAPAVIAPPAAELRLLIGKCPFHFGAATCFSPANLELAPGGAILVNPADAARLGVADGGLLKVTGPAGTASGKALLTNKVPAGLLTASPNFADLNIQQIMPGGGNCVAVTAVKG
ncbi:MAG: 2Fe-2S iron-sulfur cluster binding domain-containing protein [Deltaproteobacteria bacterium]|nr:MAG: 2Fe-2S iron-sulfur cluster binding domain-containing protein [Deltaproteobacteria bacterium]